MDACVGDNSPVLILCTPIFAIKFGAHCFVTITGFYQWTHEVGILGTTPLTSGLFTSSGEI